MARKRPETFIGVDIATTETIAFSIPASIICDIVLAWFKAKYPQYKDYAIHIADRVEEPNFNGEYELKRFEITATKEVKETHDQAQTKKES